MTERSKAAFGTWRRIRTAPRDGTRLLLWSSGPSHAEHYVGYYERGEAGEESQHIGWWTEDGGDIDPTHWMPLPAPPALSKSTPTQKGE